MSSMPRIGRRAMAVGLAALASRPAGAQTRLIIGPANGVLEFSARRLGVLPTTGRFDDFSATLLFDRNRPQSTEVSVVVRVAAITLDVPGGAALLRSRDFFDAEGFPEARFNGTGVGQGSPDRFSLAGALTIRGVTRPFRMEATLAGDGAAGQQTALLTATGALQRSEYGMTARQGLISETVRLTLRVALAL